MTTSWHHGPMVMFDLETTGVDPHRDRIVTAAAINRDGTTTRALTWLVNPGIPIPATATAVHGITDGEAATGRNPAEAVAEIARALLTATARGIPIVGHNVTFDLTMLWAELTRHRDPVADAFARITPVVDTMILDKWADPWRPKAPTARRKDPNLCGSRRLVDVARIYGITLTDHDAHGAEADALAAGRVAWRIAESTPGIQGSARELHDWQVGEKRKQAESFGAWLVKQGKRDDVAREWPIQPPPPGWDPAQLPEPTAVADDVAQPMNHPNDRPSGASGGAS